jgi:hypothetical protein
MDKKIPQKYFYTTRTTNLFNIFIETKYRENNTLGTQIIFSFIQLIILVDKGSQNII